MVERRQLGWDGDGVEGGAGGGKEGVGTEAGAGAVGAPLMLEETLVGVEVGVASWIGGARFVRAVLRIGSVGVLRPEAVEDERRVAGALGRVWMGVAELGRPGEVEEVVVEVLRGSGLRVSGLERRRSNARARSRFRRGTGMRITAGEREKKEDGKDGFLLHGGSSISGRWVDRISHTTGFLRKPGYNSCCCKWLLGLASIGQDCDVVLEGAGFFAGRAALVLGYGDGVPPTQFAE